MADYTARVRHSRRFILSTTLFCIAGPVSARVIFKADFETGDLSQWSHTGVRSQHAAPKLLPDTPNLIVTADNLFVSIVGMPHLESRFREWLARPEFRSVGGILFLRLSESLDPDRVLIRFEENSFADLGNKLPADAVEHLQAQTAIDEDSQHERLAS